MLATGIGHTFRVMPLLHCLLLWPLRACGTPALGPAGGRGSWGWVSLHHEIQLLTLHASRVLPKPVACASPSLEVAVRPHLHSLKMEEGHGKASHAWEWPAQSAGISESTEQLDNPRPFRIKTPKGSGAGWQT